MYFQLLHLKKKKKKSSHWFKKFSYCFVVVFLDGERHVCASVSVRTYHFFKVAFHLASTQTSPFNLNMLTILLYLHLSFSLFYQLL